MRWCLVSIQVPRGEFEGLDLARVDPMDCLAFLHAKVSKTRRNTSRSSPSSSTRGAISTTPTNLTPPPHRHRAEPSRPRRIRVRATPPKLCQEIPEFDDVRRIRSRADGGFDLVAVNKTPCVGDRVAIQPSVRTAPQG